MAEKGFDLHTSCEDCHSSANNLSYHVRIRQTLCDDCAEKKKDRILEINEPFAPICPCKNHNAAQAVIFCRTHAGWFCIKCAFDNHRSCQTVETRDEITKREKELSELLSRARVKEGELTVLGETTERKKHMAQENLGSLQRQISLATDEELLKVEEKRIKAAAEIVTEAEERMRKIIEDRDKKLLLVDEEAKQDRQFIDERNSKLRGNIDRVDQALQAEGTEVESWRLKVKATLAHSIAEANSMADQGIYQSDDFNAVASSLVDNTNVNVDTGSVDQIASISMGMSFSRRDGPVLGRIYASKETWEKDDEFYPSIGHSFKLKGSPNQDEVLLQEISSGKMNVTSLKKRCICKDIETKNIERTLECKSIQGKWICCGTEDGTAVMYNTKWKPMKTISVTRHHHADILISVTRDGLILAAVKNESNIHFYNPEDGKLMRSIVVANGLPIHEIHALTSGFIAVRTQCSEGPDVCILQILGDVQSTHHFHALTVHNMTVDPASDALYVMSSDLGQLVVHKVDTQQSTVTKLMSLELSPAWFYQACVIPKPGTFVISHYGKLLVYRRVAECQQLQEVLYRDDFLFPRVDRQRTNTDT